MRRLIVAIAVCLCVLYLSSCGGGDIAGYTFTPADFGITQTLTVGQLAVLALPANPSTGYSWHRSWTPEAVLKLMDEHYTPDEPQRDGSGGTQYYVFGARQAGTAVVTVQYGRWTSEPNEDPQTITLNIVN